jgi:hypothetical protein
MRSVADGLFRLRLRQVSECNFAANAWTLLIPISKCCLAGDGLLSRQSGWYERGNRNKGKADGESHILASPA